MIEVKNIEWFRTQLAPRLQVYELNYRFFDEGDFGSLNQVEFKYKEIGGSIDFWELGWLGIFVWNYETEKQLLNVLLDPQQDLEKEEALNKMLDILL